MMMMMMRTVIVVTVHDVMNVISRQVGLGKTSPNLLSYYDNTQYLVILTCLCSCLSS
jgi:hypothetical protein